MEVLSRLQLGSKVTLYRREDEEGDDGVVQTAGWLGDAGQDGERVQQVTVREEETGWWQNYMDTSLTAVSFVTSEVAMNQVLTDIALPWATYLG